MQKLTHTQIIKKIEQTEDVTAIEIIRNHNNPSECTVIINDKFFSMPYETEYNFTLLTAIKQTVNEDTLVIMFNDNELTQAWKNAYLSDGITEDRWDRRTIFHPYNEMNEMFCIDMTMLWDITDRFKGTDHELTEEKCKWRWNIIKWYKNHLI